DVVREEIELAVFRARKQPPRLDDARVQLAAAGDVEGAHAAEQVLLRRCELLQLAIVDLDRFSEQLRRQTLIVAADQPREGGTLLRRRAAIPRDQIRLRADRRQPFAIDIAPTVAEEVDRAEQRVT